MPSGVQFDEPGNDVMPVVRQKSDAFSFGVPRSLGGNLFMLGFAVLLVIGTFYMFASAVPKEPARLGADTLEPRESVGPNYRQ
jgi:hypothetical protein